jgi:hypothetical protein
MFTNMKLGLKRTPDEVMVRAPEIVKFLEPSSGQLLIGDSCSYGQRTKSGLWGMLGNNFCGCCFWSMLANLMMTQQLNSDQPVQVITTETVLNWYRWTGFDRDAQLNRDGSNPTDNGTDPIWGLQKAVQEGLIQAWGKVDPLNDAHVAMAIETFGGIGLAVDVPEDWMSSQVWGPSDKNIIGRHAIACVGFDEECNTENETWAEIIDLLKAGKDRHCWGAFAIVTKQWRRANGKSLQGLDLSGLVAQLARVG